MGAAERRNQRATLRAANRSAHIAGMTDRPACTPADGAGVRRAISSFRCTRSSSCLLRGLESERLGPTDALPALVGARHRRPPARRRSSPSFLSSRRPPPAVGRPVEASASLVSSIHQPVERRVGGSGAPAEPASDHGSARGDGPQVATLFALARPVRARALRPSPGQARTSRRTGSTSAATTPSGGCTSSRFASPSAHRR